MFYSNKTFNRNLSRNRCAHPTEVLEPLGSLGTQFGKRWTTAFTHIMTVLTNSPLWSKMTHIRCADTGSKVRTEKAFIACLMCGVCAFFS